jgi:hypothetical protein
VVVKTAAAVNIKTTATAHAYNRSKQDSRTAAGNFRDKPKPLMHTNAVALDCLQPTGG